MVLFRWRITMHTPLLRVRQKNLSWYSGLSSCYNKQMPLSADYMAILSAKIC